MKINSWTKSVKYGFCLGAISISAWVGFTYLLLILGGGENYIGKNESVQAIPFLPLTAVCVPGGVIAALIPVRLLHYSTEKYLFLNIAVSSITYIALFMILCIFDGLDTLDALLYGIVAFPIGSALGTFLAINENKFEER